MSWTNHRPLLRVGWGGLAELPVTHAEQRQSKILQQMQSLINVLQHPAFA
jgi:hypothetical protein